MITGELKSKVDRVWDAFWSGGISNPLEVIEQITYLLFLRRLDDLQTLAEQKARRTGGVIDNPVYLPGQRHLRWSELKNNEPAVMHKVMGEEVFPFLRDAGADGSTYAEHMRDARFTIPTPALLQRVVDLLDDIPMHDRDTNGDLYEYLLSKIASAGVNGQFRTPRHIIELMVAMTAPTPEDEICDPACGTAGFLVAASDHIREHHPSAMTDARQRRKDWSEHSRARTDLLAHDDPGHLRRHRVRHPYPLEHPLRPDEGHRRVHPTLRVDGVGLDGQRAPPPGG